MCRQHQHSARLALNAMAAARSLLACCSLLCSAAAAASGMTQEEMKSCRVFFNNFDRSVAVNKEGEGRIKGRVAESGGDAGSVLTDSLLSPPVCSRCLSFLPPLPRSPSRFGSCPIPCLVRSKSGTINGWELQIALEAMGQNPQEDDIKTIIVQLGAEKNGTLGQQQSDTGGIAGCSAAQRTEWPPSQSARQCSLSVGCLVLCALAPFRFHSVPQGHPNAARHREAAGQRS